MSSSSAMCVDDPPNEEGNDQKSDASNKSDKSKSDNDPVLLDAPVSLLEEIKFLLEYFAVTTYKAETGDCRGEIALSRSIEFIERDYKVMTIDNSNGNFTQYYPAKLLIFENELSDNAIPEDTLQKNRLLELLRSAYMARVRTRFPVPVILFKGKYVLRSATLTGMGEAVGRVGLGYLMPSEASQSDGSLDAVIESGMQPEATPYLKPIERARSADRLLLDQFKVSTIIDLMVENRKVKLYMPVTSSEKIETDSYYARKFKLISFPYPGCEFFTSFHSSNFEAEGLKFDWTQSEIDANLTLPRYPALDYLNINWEKYKEWDLIQITQNYLTYILKYLQDNDSGILIHCISGWDRTPLFISLIRLSLWADGLVHKSLNEEEILYLTLAYDWLLFGHRLNDRLQKQEDILLFCFAFLKHILSDEFSLLPARSKVKKQEKPDSANGHTSESNGSGSGAYKAPIVALDDNGFLPMELNEPSPPRTAEAHSSDRVEGTPEKVARLEEVSNSPSRQCQHRRKGSPIIPFKRTSHRVGSYDSVSSLGSWGVVTGTGSLQSSFDLDMESTMEDQSSPESDPRPDRKARLSQVRLLFYQCYYKTSARKNLKYFGHETMAQAVTDAIGNLLGYKQIKDKQ